ncbi:MAG: hypothetical protein DRJ01_01100 [Bacteroidetes bacterium]|nr:MAG: hypothetical protein DRJ01_01100 [Bacteroidota bacterium]
MSNVFVVSGRSNKSLSKDILQGLGSLGKEVPTIITDFPNKEIFVKYKESIRGKDVFIIQTFNGDPNKDLVETLILADTAFAASADRITLVLPIIYGSRQDRKSSPRTPITISMMAKVIKSVGVDRVITVSLHAPQSSAAFYAAGLRFDNISSAQIFLPDMKNLHKTEDFVIVSPDAGGLSKARYYAKVLGADIAFADKRRGADRKSEVMHLVGDVKNRNVFIVDDMIDGGGTILNVVEALKNNGAKDIYCIATHLVLSNSAIKKLDESPIKKIYGSNSIVKKNLPDKFIIKSLGKTLADIISRIHSSESIDFMQEDEE